MTFFSTYYPPSQSEDYYFSRVSNSLDAFSPIYDRFLLVGNFNANYFKETLFNFLQKHNAANIVKDKTCFKSFNNLSCIHLFITSRLWRFQNTTVFSTGLSDFHKIAIAALKTSFSKRLPKEMIHRDYKNFAQDKFQYELKNRNKNEPIECYSEFEKVFADILKEHTPFKKKFLRVNYACYMTKRLRKAIVKRTELISKYLKFKTQESLKYYQK